MVVEKTTCLFLTVSRVLDVCVTLCDTKVAPLKESPASSEENDMGVAMAHAGITDRANTNHRVPMYHQRLLI